MDYFNGKASLRFIGYPAIEAWNLDRDLRVWHSSTGCFESGFEPLTNNANNFAVRLWSSVFGHQPNVYHGYFPDRKTARVLIDSLGQPVTLRGQKLKGSFSISNRPYTLSSPIGDFQVSDNLPARVIIMDDLIILQPIRQDNLLITYLDDKETGEVFARYWDRVSGREEQQAEGTNRVFQVH